VKAECKRRAGVTVLRRVVRAGARACVRVCVRVCVGCACLTGDDDALG
jgi:hypothetical protein